jgi:DNA-binding IclR family transcriptional regulator
MRIRIQAMLELHILKYLMTHEHMSDQERGRLLGWSLSYFREKNGIPKGTFYRAVKVLVSEGFIIKQKRGFYLLSDEFRFRCNHIKDGDFISSL